MGNGMEEFMLLENQYLLLPFVIPRLCDLHPDTKILSPDPNYCIFPHKVSDSYMGKNKENLLKE